MALKNLANDPDVYDVAICGGGLAGLTLARQLKQQVPQISIIVIDRQMRPLPEATLKVGESTVEVGAYYLGTILNLNDYLEQKHLKKLGLRFFFGDPNGPFQDRPEFGLSNFPGVNSYQIDRGILENDLRQFNVDAGIKLVEGCSVKDIVLSESNHNCEIIYITGNSDSPQTVRARWVIDAMGRRRFLQKKLGLTKDRGKRCSSAWFRLEGRIDVSDLVSPDDVGWHNRVPGNIRYYSTNHLMGNGYWVWIIPLSSNNTSIGIVTMESIHPFDEYNTYEKALDWLKKHEPIFASHIKDREPLDFRCMRRYSFSSRQIFSTDRWACVGDAAVFSDPFYSPATDLIGFANMAITEMVKAELAGNLSPETVTNYNDFIVSLNDHLTYNIQFGYPFYGNAMVMTSKLIWDTAAGWALFGPQMFNAIFLDPEKSLQLRRIIGKLFFLTRRMQRLFVDWDAKSPGRCSYKFLNYLQIPFLKDLRLRNLQANKSMEELVKDFEANMETFEELAQVFFLLAIEDVMPEYIDQFSSDDWLNALGISLNPDRWQDDRLFEPMSRPDKILGIREQIRGLFEFNRSHNPQAELTNELAVSAA